MRCWSSKADAAPGSLTRRARRLGHGLLLAGLLGLATVSASAAPGDPEVREAQVVLTDDGAYAVTADFLLELRPRLEEAVTRGVPLYFAIDFEISRPRWYWLDDKVVSQTLTLQLSYHALTRQYRLSNGNLHQSFRSLDDAVAILTRLRRWPLPASAGLKAGESYQAGIRLRLDTSLLPKPFQVTALANRDWTLVTDWKRWTFVAPQPTPAVESKPVDAAAKPEAKPEKADAKGDGK